MLFQNQSANLHPKMTMEEMLDESLRLHQPGLSAPARKDYAVELADRVGLKERMGQRPASLSGGEKRRAGLARILATKPEVIVADEPTSGLDAAIKLQIIDLLKSLKEESLSYVIISHDLGLVRRIADRVIVMLHGCVIEEFSADCWSKGGDHHPYTDRLIRASLLDREDRESNG
jgi:ABC-type glutathione transport system ATPase component